MKRHVLMVLVVLGMCVAVMAFSSSDSAVPPSPTPTVDYVHGDGPIEASQKCKCPQGCALQRRMKKTMQKIVAAGDLKKLAREYDRLAANPPNGDFPKWKKIADDGAKKARAGDMKGAKKACKECHKTYQKRYRKDDKERCGGWP